MEGCFSVLPECLVRFLFLYLSASDLTNAALVSHGARENAEGAAKAAIEYLMNLNERLFHGQTFNAKRTKYIRLLAEITRERIILVGGGSIDGGPDSYRRCDEYDTMRGTWSVLESMSMRRGSFKTEALAFLGLVVVISGDDANSVGTLEAYNPLSNTWSALPSLPRRLMLMAAAAQDRTMYVMGGLDKATGQYSDAMFGWHINSREWFEVRARLLSPRYGHAAISYGDRIWVIGGQTCTPDDPSMDGYSNSVEIYDPALEEWKMGPSMKERRIWARLVVANGMLYAVGGDVDDCGAPMSPTIERYNQQMGSWELVTSFPRNRRLFAVTSVKNKIYVFGGRDGNDYTALPDWDAFDVNKNTWESVSYSKPTMQRRLPKLCFYGGQTVTLPSPFMQWSACDEGNR